MVTIKSRSELPSLKVKLESSLVRFLAHDFLDGPTDPHLLYQLESPGLRERERERVLLNINDTGISPDPC